MTRTGVPTFQMSLNALKFGTKIGVSLPPNQVFNITNSHNLFRRLPVDPNEGRIDKKVGRTNGSNES